MILILFNIFFTLSVLFYLITFIFSKFSYKIINILHRQGSFWWFISFKFQNIKHIKTPFKFEIFPSGIINLIIRIKIINLVALCNGDDPARMKFDQLQLRNHFNEQLHDRGPSIQNFPHVLLDSVPDYEIIKMSLADVVINFGDSVIV